MKFGSTNIVVFMPVSDNNNNKNDKLIIKLANL